MPSANPLLDTHILLWLLAGSNRLKEVPHLSNFSSWCLSPVSFLEMKFLVEIGRLKMNLAAVLARLRQDERFHIDDVSLDNLCDAALDLDWTHDPFDRLLVAHSITRSLPLITADRIIQANYPAAL